MGRRSSDRIYDATLQLNSGVMLAINAADLTSVDITGLLLYVPDSARIHPQPHPSFIEVFD
jgi:hypothetical protein